MRAMELQNVWYKHARLRMKLNGSNLNWEFYSIVKWENLFKSRDANPPIKRPDFNEVLNKTYYLQK